MKKVLEVDTDDGFLATVYVTNVTSLCILKYKCKIKCYLKSIEQINFNVYNILFKVYKLTQNLESNHPNT